jgi:hypothetical protein
VLWFIWVIVFIIVVMYLVLRFWKVSLSILAVLGLVIAIHQAYQAHRARATEEHIAAAQASPTPQTWWVDTDPDPASGALWPRYASVLSDDGLCQLVVEERLDGDRLTSIQCPGLPIHFDYFGYLDYFDYDTRVGVKFDTTKTSETMEIERFNDADDDESVYIDSSQDGYGALQYDDFLRRIASSRKLALELDFRYVGEHWIRFSLDGSTEALTKIAALPGSPPRRPIAAGEI